MNCPNCNSNINQGEYFCKVCGTRVIFQSQENITPINNNVVQNNFETQNSQYSYQQQNNYDQPLYNNYQQQSTYINNDMLINAYIGKNVEKLKNAGFSANTFFLGTLYVFYRKMWLLGILWIVGALIISIFLPSLAGTLSIAANIYISIEFKKWYLKHVEEKVEKIKLENPGMNQEQLASICMQKGGTTVLPVIALIIFYIIVMFLVFLFILGVISEEIEKENSNLEIEENISTNKYETLSDISFIVPNEFEIGSYSTEFYESYSLITNEDYCRLSLMNLKSSRYNSGKSYLEKNMNYSSTDIVSGIEEKEINGNIWHTATIQKKSNTSYYYAILKEDKIYEVEFVIYDDETGSCNKAHTTIINSLEFN